MLLFVVEGVSAIIFVVVITVLSFLKKTFKRSNGGKYKYPGHASYKGAHLCGRHIYYVKYFNLCRQ